MQISSLKRKKPKAVHLTQATSLFSYQEATMISTHHIIFMPTLASCGQSNDEQLLFALW
jgi:hypothetical protein